MRQRRRRHRKNKRESHKNDDKKTDKKTPAKAAPHKEEKEKGKDQKPQQEQKKPEKKNQLVAKKEQVVLKTPKQFDQSLAEKIMKANSESKCLIIEGVDKQKKKVQKDAIRAFMEKARLTTFFLMDVHETPCYFITLDTYI